MFIIIDVKFIIFFLKNDFSFENKFLMNCNLYILFRFYECVRVYFKEYIDNVFYKIYIFWGWKFVFVNVWYLIFVKDSNIK